MGCNFTVGQFLAEAVKPAVGCTEPVAVALAVARARECLGEPAITARVTLSSNVYKNGATVGIPGTGGLKGNLLAAALAMSAGNSEDGLQILKSITAGDIPAAKDKMEKGRVYLDLDRSRGGVYVLANLHSENHTASCLIEGGHANIVKVIKDKKTIYKKETQGGSSPSIMSQIAKMTWDEVFECLDGITDSDINFLLDGVKMNLAMAEHGFANDIGASVGKRLKENTPDFDKTDISLRIKATAAAAADARMGGAQMPVMSSAGSGNHGITAIIPIAVYAREKNTPREKLAHALAISHLTTTYIKSRTGGLSTTCGCSFAAGAGSAAGIAWLMTENFDVVREAVELMLGNLVGMLCDGGKNSCALKVGTGAAEAYHSALIAANSGGQKIGAQGIIGEDIDETAHNSMLVANSMSGIEQSILDILARR